MSNKKTLFISDLHLEVLRPSITDLFLGLLERVDKNIDALYILGDLFEAWIGDDDDTPFHREIVSALNNATQKGLKIFFLAGNRDFLIGARFARETGCELLPDEKKIDLYGTSVLLMHGDTLCTNDIAYLKWRKKSRNRFLHTIFFLMWPLRLRKHLANKMRAASHEHTKMAANNIMDVTQREVERVMQKHQVKTLIHGHTHRPDTHRFSLNNETAERIVLDAWHDHGSVLVWHEDGRKEVLTL